jgi:hypothetical protein
MAVDGMVVTVLTDPPAPHSQTAALSWKAFPAAEQGWKKIESRKSHHKQLKAVAPPRQRMPVDLISQCFNYFLP